MTGFSLEHIRQDGVVEDGLMIRREYLDNGVRVVTVEDVESMSDIGEPVLSVECFEEGATLQECLDLLRDSLEGADGELTDEIREAVAQTGKCLNAYIRGICKMDDGMECLPQDGIIYIPFPDRQSRDTESVQEQMDRIVEQLKNYF